MAPISKSLFRCAILSFTIITLCAVAFLFRERDGRFGVRGDVLNYQTAFATTDSEEFVVEEPSNNLFERLDLTEEECGAVFPDLTRDIDDAVKRGSFVFEKSNPDYQGLVQGRIKGGKLYVLTVAPDATPEILHQRTAILHQVHRALLSSRTSLPDTHFAFVINDSPKNNSWVFATPNKVSTYNTWLMPNFAFWSWPKPDIGVFDDIIAGISDIEASTPFMDKIDKVAWRGTAWFNPLGRPNLRHTLLTATKDKDWADVEKFEISKDGKANNSLKIEDFCKYKYIVYTEGVTYSGRLPYHQACRSVLITPPLTYLTTSAWIMKPISAEDLMAEQHGARKTLNTGEVQPLLETMPSYQKANAIYVAPDFSNLEAVVDFLRSYPGIAQRIAENQRISVTSGGYLSPAAEACYWRALIRGWASVAVTGEEWGEELGERFETWIVKQVVPQKRS